VGSVALWGRIIEHEHGYRSEFAYPQRLRLVCSICFWQLGDRGAPPFVATIGREGAVTPLCEAHLKTAGECGFAIRDRRSAAGLQAELLGAYLTELLPA